LAFFKEEFSDVLQVMPTLLEDWKHNPACGLMYTKCFPFHDSDKTVLLGDAAHPIIPFYGQGVNCGFEDCLKLDELLATCSTRKEAFEQFSITRKPNVDAISDLSHMNFVEVRKRKLNTSRWLLRQDHNYF
jgi:kynurenine 3-monooxygenase